MRSVDTVIIGAGQAGLAMSHWLSERGRDHVVLERGRLAERWRSERWDSMRLLSPNWMTTIGARSARICSVLRSATRSGIYRPAGPRNPANGLNERTSARRRRRQASRSRLCIRAPTPPLRRGRPLVDSARPTARSTGPHAEER